MDIIKTIALCSTLMLLAYIVADMDSELQVQAKEQALYCEMVSLHLEDETLGWPDYKGTYERACK